MGAPFQVAGNDAAEALQAQLCLDMRVAGQSFRQIAEEMTRRGHPMGQTTAFRRVQWAIDKILAPGVEQLRKVEGERLDLALRMLLPRVAKGDVRAVMAWVRVSESRRRLFGLDMPAKTEVDMTVSVDPSEIEIVRQIREWKASRETSKNGV
jgi:hypothetical protein